MENNADTMIDEVIDETVDIVDPEDSFDDLFTDQEDIPDEPEQEPAEDTAPAEPETGTIRFKHLDFERDLDKKSVTELAKTLGNTPEEVVAMLQKGRDYDNARSRLDQLTNAQQATTAYQPAIDAINDFAVANNVNAGDAARYVSEMMATTARNQLISEIRAAYPALDADAVARMADDRIGMSRIVQQNQRYQMAEQRKQQENKPWVDFFVAHPEFKADTIPEEVITGTSQGLSPEESYLRYEVSRLKAEAEAASSKSAAKEKATANKQKEVGSLSGNLGDTKKDLFDEGWDSAF